MGLLGPWSRPSGPRRAMRIPHLPPPVVHGMLVVGGVAVFVMLAWGHLGLGALLFPPPSGQIETATSGPYRVTVDLTGGQFVVGNANSATIEVRDGAGHEVDGATVRVVPRMVTMRMAMPEEIASAEGGGRYTFHPAFEMAGQWRLDVTVARQGAAPQPASFDASVRWRSAGLARPI